MCKPKQLVKFERVRVSTSRTLNNWPLVENSLQTLEPRFSSLCFAMKLLIVVRAWNVNNLISRNETKGYSHYYV